MTARQYLRLDVGFTEHPKVVALPDSAFRLYVHMLAYCARNLTDGYVPADMLRALAGESSVSNRRRVAERLVTRGLIHETDTGYVVHDYLDWQSSRRDVMAARAKDAERKRRSRAKGAATSPAVSASPVTPDKGRDTLRVTPDIARDRAPMSRPSRGRGRGTGNKSSSNSREYAPADDDEEEIHKQSNEPEHEPAREPEAEPEAERNAGQLPDDDPLAWLTAPVPEPSTEPRVAAAIAALAYQDLLRRQAAPGTPVADPAAWLKAAQARRLDSDGATLAAYAADHPEASVTELAQHAHPTPSGQPSQSNASAHDAQQAAMLRKAREWKPSGNVRESQDSDWRAGLTKARRALGPPDR